MATKASVEDTIRTIKRKTRRKHSAEEKIRIVLKGLRRAVPSREHSTKSLLENRLKCLISFDDAHLEPNMWGGRNIGGRSVVPISHLQSKLTKPADSYYTTVSALERHQEAGEAFPKWSALPWFH